MGQRSPNFIIPSLELKLEVDSTVNITGLRGHRILGCEQWIKQLGIETDFSSLIDSKPILNNIFTLLDKLQSDTKPQDAQNKIKDIIYNIDVLRAFTLHNKSYLELLNTLEQKLIKLNTELQNKAHLIPSPVKFININKKEELIIIDKFYNRLLNDNEETSSIKSGLNALKMYYLMNEKNENFKITTLIDIENTYEGAHEETFKDLLSLKTPSKILLDKKHGQPVELPKETETKDVKESKEISDYYYDDDETRVASPENKYSGGFFKNNDQLTTELPIAKEQNLSKNPNKNYIIETEKKLEYYKKMIEKTGGNLKYYQELINFLKGQLQLLKENKDEKKTDTLKQEINEYIFNMQSSQKFKVYSNNNSNCQEFIRICDEHLRIFRNEMLEIYQKQKKLDDTLDKTESKKLFDENFDTLLNDKTNKSEHYKTLAQEYKAISRMRQFVSNKKNFPDPEVRVQMGFDQLNKNLKYLLPQASKTFWGFIKEIFTRITNRLVNAGEADTHKHGEEAVDSLRELQHSVNRRIR